MAGPMWQRRPNCVSGAGGGSPQSTRVVGAVLACVTAARTVAQQRWPRSGEIHEIAVPALNPKESLELIAKTARDYKSDLAHLRAVLESLGIPATFVLIITLSEGQGEKQSHHSRLRLPIR